MAPLLPAPIQPSVSLGQPREVICFLLFSPSTMWGLEELPNLSLLPPHLLSPVQTVDVGVWLSPYRRIISTVMYIQTHALLLERTRQGNRACAAGQRGFITRLLNLNLSPPGMGVLIAPKEPAPQKSILVWLTVGLPPFSLTPSCSCLALHLTLLPQLQVWIWGLPQGHWFKMS